MKLKEMTEKFPETKYWNDSCAIDELTYAIKHGATGATTNPVIVTNVLKDNLQELENHIVELCRENSEKTEDEIAWKVIGELGSNASQYLLPTFETEKGQSGRLSFQVNAKYYNNKEKIIEHGLELSALVPNSQIKVPASKEGIEACEELTYLGVSINATVSYTVAQAVAVAEAVERGLERRKAEGLNNEMIAPVCTLMSGRLDDYIKEVVDENNIIVDPETLEYPGVAVAKRAYDLYRDRNYKTKILIAAFRNHYHWSEFIGGNIILTIPYKWQKRFNQSNIEIKSNIQKPVPHEYLKQLQQIDEFVVAYDEKGHDSEDFHTYGAFKKTINQFLYGYDELVTIIREIKLEC